MFARIVASTNNLHKTWECSVKVLEHEETTLTATTQQTNRLRQPFVIKIKLIKVERVESDGREFMIPEKKPKNQQQKQNKSSLNVSFVNETEVKWKEGKTVLKQSIKKK